MDIAASAAILGRLEGGIEGGGGAPAIAAAAVRNAHKAEAKAAHEKRQQHKKQEQQQHQQNKSSSAPPPAVAQAVAVNADTKAATMTFDAFVATGEVKKWDTCAPHAFLRWLNADLARVYENKSTKQVVVYPIDYAERSGNLAEFDGFDVSLEPRIVCAVNSAAMDELVTRLAASRKRTVSDGDSVQEDSNRHAASKL